MSVSEAGFACLKSSSKARVFPCTDSAATVQAQCKTAHYNGSRDV